MYPLHNKTKNIPVGCEPSSCNHARRVVGLGPGEQGPVEGITPCTVIFMVNTCLGDLSPWIRAPHLRELNVLQSVLLPDPASHSASIPMETMSPRKPMTMNHLTFCKWHIV